MSLAHVKRESLDSYLYLKDTDKLSNSDHDTVVIQLVNRHFYVRLAGAFSGVAQPLVNPHAPAQPRPGRPARRRDDTTRRHGDACKKTLEFLKFLDLKSKVI